MAALRSRSQAPVHVGHGQQRQPRLWGGIQAEGQIRQVRAGLEYLNDRGDVLVYVFLRERRVLLGPLKDYAACVPYRNCF